MLFKPQIQWLKENYLMIEISFLPSWFLSSRICNQIKQIANQVQIAKPCHHWLFLSLFDYKDVNDINKTKIKKIKRNTTEIKKKVTI